MQHATDERRHEDSITRQSGQSASGQLPCCRNNSLLSQKRACLRQDTLHNSRHSAATDSDVADYIGVVIVH